MQAPPPPDGPGPAIPNLGQGSFQGNVGGAARARPSGQSGKPGKPVGPRVLPSFTGEGRRVQFAPSRHRPPSFRKSHSRPRAHPARGARSLRPLISSQVWGWTSTGPSDPAAKGNGGWPALQASPRADLPAGDWHISKVGRPALAGPMRMGKQDLKRGQVPTRAFAPHRPGCGPEPGASDWAGRPRLVGPLPRGRNKRRQRVAGASSCARVPGRCQSTPSDHASWHATTVSARSLPAPAARGYNNCHWLGASFGGLVPGGARASCRQGMGPGRGAPRCGDGSVLLGRFGRTRPHVGWPLTFAAVRPRLHVAGESSRQRGKNKGRELKTGGLALRSLGQGSAGIWKFPGRGAGGGRPPPTRGAWIAKKAGEKGGARQLIRGSKTQAAGGAGFGPDQKGTTFLRAALAQWPAAAGGGKQPFVGGRRGVGPPGKKAHHLAGVG